MYFLKKLPVLALFFCLSFPALGMSRTKAFFGKKALFATAAVATTAGVGYAKKEKVAEYHEKFSHKVDYVRVDILKHEKSKTFKEKFPASFHLLVVAPLLHRIRYNSLTEYAQESDETTKRKQDIAKTLCVAGVQLGVTQTEADLLTYEHNIDKKWFITRLGYDAFSVHLGKPYVYKYAEAAFSKEKELAAKEQYVVYHGTDNVVYAADYIGTKLQTIDQPDNQSFLALRQRENHSLMSKIISFFSSTTESDEELLKRDKKMRDEQMTQVGFDHMVCEKSATRYHTSDKRAQLFREKIDQNYDYVPNIQRYRLSCTPAITNGVRWYINRGWIESALMASTGVHTEKNKVGQLQFDCHTIPQDILQKYKSRLESVQKKFGSQSSGILLQIILSCDLMDKSIYPALAGGGVKHNVYTNQTPRQKFEKPSELFAEIRNNPFNVHVKQTEDNCSGIDPLQLRMVVDKSLLLDPNNPEVQQGFKVKAYAVNQEALDTFHKEVDAIVAEMRAEMQASKK